MNNAIIDKQKKEKLCIIEDIMKAQKLAFGMGLGYETIIKEPEKVFYPLYDMDTADLESIFKAIQRQISAKARLIAGIDHE